MDESFESPFSEPYPEDVDFAVALQNDGKIVLSGYFTQLNGVPAAHILPMPINGFILQLH